jgi:hypothetical protein
MRSIFTFLVISLTFLGSSFGKQIEVNTAKAVGQSFLKGHSLSPAFQNAIQLELVYTAKSSQAASSGTPCFFVFNTSAGNGFVVVSGDDRTIPVLAYSDATGFNPDRIPAHVAAWLDGYINQVTYAVKNDIKQTPEIGKEWKTLLSGHALTTAAKTKPSIGPLLQTTWDQSPYYNDLCPFDIQYNERTVTGCVATAMAQVMKYWNFPATGSGFHSFNSNSFGTLSADFGSTTYNWTSMPASISGPNDAIATLMYHCGVSVDMNYGVGSQGGSSAYVVSSQSPVTNCAEYALKTYFGYPASIQGVVRETYTDAQWISMLKTELDASRPVLYAGFGSGGGHCFVCDGYDQGDMFHFNWGWSGYYDGYFTVDALNPGGVGTGGGTGGFNSGQQAVIGVEAAGGAQTYDIRLYNYVTPSAATIYYGEAFTITTSIANYGAATFSGDFCAAVFDNNLAFVDYVEILSGASLPQNNYYSDLVFSTNGLLAMLPGSFYIGIFYRPTGGNWYQVSNDGNYSNLIGMTVINPNTIEMNSSMSVNPGTTLTRGQPVTVQLSLINNGTSVFNGKLDVSIYNLDGSFAAEIQQLDNKTLQPGVGSTMLSFYTGALAADPGTYLLAVQYYPNGGSNWELTGSTNFQNPVEVTVQEEGLSQDAYEPNNSITSAYQLPLSFSGTTGSANTQGSNCNTGNDYDFYKLDLPPGYTYNVTGQIYDAHNGGGQTYTLDAMFSYSTDGNTFSPTYDDSGPVGFDVYNGGNVWFDVSPKFTGQTGTYQLDITVKRYPVGIAETGSPEVLSVFPNPAASYINIDLSALNRNVYRISLLDILGTELVSMKPGSNRIPVRIALADISDGVYYIRVDSDQGMITRKILVQK